MFLQTNLTHILLPNIWNIWHTWYTWCNERLETRCENYHKSTIRFTRYVKTHSRARLLHQNFPERKREREDSRGMNKLPRFVRWPRCGRKPRAKHERFVIASRLPRQTWRFRNRLHLMKFRGPAIAISVNDIGAGQNSIGTCIQNSLFNFSENRYLKFFPLEITNAILPLHLFSTLWLSSWDKIFNVQLNTTGKILLDTYRYSTVRYCRGCIHDFLFDSSEKRTSTSG